MGECVWKQEGKSDYKAASTSSAQGQRRLKSPLRHKDGATTGPRNEFSYRLESKHPCNMYFGGLLNWGMFHLDGETDM